MGKAVMEEGDRDMGNSQTAEGCMGGEEEKGRAAKREKKMVMDEWGSGGVKVWWRRVDRMRDGWGRGVGLSYYFREPSFHNSHV